MVDIIMVNKVDDFFIPDNEVKLPVELDYSHVDSFPFPTNSFACVYQMYRILLIVLFIILSTLNLKAVNIVTYTVSDSIEISSDKLEID